MSAFPSLTRIVISSLLVVAFGASAYAAPAVVKRKNEDNLTEAFANFRRAQIKQVDYELSVDLKKGSETFGGEVVINAQLAQLKAPLSIDVKVKEIRAIKINGAEIKDYVSRIGSLDIPVKYLKDNMRIEIAYTGEFSKEGNGFQRVTDPADKSEYTYTDFEPYQAHYLFPCFDQPDLKASFKLKVTAPADWKVIGNDLIESTSAAESSPKEYKLTVTRFKTTPRISTYLFFVGAGEFTLWKDKHGDIPLELYARKSLAKYVDHKRIFDSTKKGLTFFGDYFGYKYPFAKYGQVFVPEFAWGGMENPGAVTLNERGIYRGTPKQSDLDDRDDLILHEMAHMWFGDLVTMRWWNDLWLNESFASYLASIATDRALNVKATWFEFFSTKNWGYWQDQLVTTHPIETKVQDVRTAKGNFDGITYAKGAASLKQLHFYVGEEGFREGLRNYFKKYAFKNTLREDFIREIATASKKDLSGWTKTWLQSAGPQRVKVDWSCKSENGVSKLSRFAIQQTANTSKVLSPHRTRIGFFKRMNNGKFEQIKTIDASYEKATTVLAEAKGLACPDFVYANVDDQDYALFSLDAVSLKAVQDVLRGGIDQPLTRLMVWSTLNQMVRDTSLRVSDYFEIVLAGLEKESDPAVLSVVLGNHSTIRDSYFQYLTRDQRTEMAPRLENLVWQKASEAPTTGGLRMIYFDFYSTIANSQAAATRIEEFLKGKASLKGVDIDQDRRWKLISDLARTGAGPAPAIIAAEEKADPSTTGKRNAFAARVSLPTAEAKKEFWTNLEKWKEVPYSNLRAASGKFNHPDKVELSEPYVKPFFQAVKAVNWADSENDNLIEIYFERMFPQTICSKGLLKESQSNLKASANLTPLVRRSWLEANDELGRCVAVRAADKAKVKERQKQLD